MIEDNQKHQKGNVTYDEQHGSHLPQHFLSQPIFSHSLSLPLALFDLWTS